MQRYLLTYCCCVSLSVNLSVAYAMDALAPLKACVAIQDGHQRLACFDREMKALQVPSFSGRNSMVTPRFEVRSPTRLRFQSDGAIFVMYLKHSDEEVVQNLHLGGGGEDSYIIQQPGSYFLQINGSETWRVWLEEVIN